MMYLKFMTSQLSEYNKIINTLNSSTTISHHNIVTHMLENFGKICDLRRKKLKKNAWEQAFKCNWTGIYEYRAYVKSTTEQVKNLIYYCNSWLEQYKQWEQDMIKEDEENKNFRGDKVTVIGFSKLLKRKKSNNKK